MFGGAGGRKEQTPISRQIEGGRVALEVEWNNKDPFFGCDPSNLGLQFDVRAIDVGIIITRASELQGIFNQLGEGVSYGASTNPSYETVATAGWRRMFCPYLRDQASPFMSTTGGSYKGRSDSDAEP